MNCSSNKMPAKKSKRYRKRFDITEGNKILEHKHLNTNVIPAFFDNSLNVILKAKHF